MHPGTAGHAGTRGTRAEPCDAAPSAVSSTRPDAASAALVAGAAVKKSSDSPIVGRSIAIRGIPINESRIPIGAT